MHELTPGPPLPPPVDAMYRDISFLNDTIADLAEE